MTHKHHAQNDFPDNNEPILEPGALPPMSDIDFQLRVSQSLGRIEASQEFLRNEILGPGGRIVKIEDKLDWQDKKQWLHTAVIIPLFAIRKLLNL